LYFARSKNFRDRRVSFEHAEALPASEQTQAPAGLEGDRSVMTKTYRYLLPLLLCLAPLGARAQSFRVQCPTTTVTHPDPSNNGVNNSEPAYNGPTVFGTSAGGFATPTSNVNGAIKCMQISGGDGYATMADGTQTFMFSFGPLSGLAKIASGQPGTDFPNEFNAVFPGTLSPGDPATTVDNGGAFGYNGAVGLVPDGDCVASNAAATASVPPLPLPCPNLPASGLDGHVDPRQIMDIGVMNGNIPAPMMAIDEDDEYFLTLSNVGMIMRPDLFEQHTVHFHGYPNASSVYDGVPDASVAINIGASFTYYYLAPDAGTYFWHCHITPPEHLQMGMVGQLYVRPRQNRVTVGTSLYASLQQQELDKRTACISAADILCSNPLPAVNTGALRAASGNYAYNDGDGSSYYDVEYPLQIHGFDPNFHFVGMTFNPEGFADMKDKYFLLNGRSYPDTVMAGPMQTSAADGRGHFSQPLPAIINIKVGQRALLRISDLDVTEYQTLASLGIRMTVIGYNAKLLRDQAGNNMAYNTNSITLAGGESLDVILDTCTVARPDPSAVCTAPMATGTYYLFTPNLDHLSNDAENFGGLMTEVHVTN
jgi:FtsP/CotA-like multicopper oxidase with cupredoxin domain